MYGHTRQISQQLEVNLMFKTVIGIAAVAVFIGFALASPPAKETLEKSLEDPRSHNEIRFELGKDGAVHPVHYIEFESPVILGKLPETTKIKSEN